MQKLKWQYFIALLVMAALPATSFAENIQSCGSTSVKTGKTYKVNGSEINVRKGPGTNFGKIVNQKATSILKKLIT